jgi:hypothetical protein
MTIKNFYTATTIEPGDVFLVTIKAMVQYDGSYRLYRCPAVRIGGEPQGDRLYKDEQVVAEAIFPILQIANGPDPS